MAVEQNILKAQRWFTAEDKNLRFTLTGEDGETPEDATGMTFVFTMSDDPEGNVELTKTSSLGGVVVAGTFNADPDLNQQYIEVRITLEDTQQLFKGKHYYALRRADVGFRNVLTFGYWEAQKAAGG